MDDEFVLGDNWDCYLGIDIEYMGDVFIDDFNPYFTKAEWQSISNAANAWLSFTGAGQKKRLL